MNRKTVLITGSSSGIGYELAKVFAKNNYDLILTARNREKLLELKEEIEQSKEVNVHIYDMDLSSQKGAINLFESIEEDGVCIDLLINNAGVGICELFSKSSVESLENIINLNILQLTILTRLFVHKMLERRSGNIINICSTGAYQPGPYVSVYYASKAYLRSFSQALENELRGSGVNVMTVYPGAVKSNFSFNAGTKDLSNAMESEKVAHIIFKDYKKGRKRCIPGTMNRISIVASKLIPGNISAKFVRKIKEKQKV